MRYGLKIDGFVFDRHPVTGVVFTLPGALTEARGCGNAEVVRLVDGGRWETVVLRAGSDTEVVHRRTGRRIRRRSVPRSGPAAVWGAFPYGAQRNKQRLIERLTADEREAQDVVTADVVSFEWIRASAAGAPVLVEAQERQLMQVAEARDRAERAQLRRCVDRLDAAVQGVDRRVQQFAGRVLRSRD